MPEYDNNSPDLIQWLIDRITNLEQQTRMANTRQYTFAPDFRIAEPGSSQQGAISVDKTGGDLFKYYSSGEWRVPGFNLVWYYIGTPGVDGVDALLAANPHPYATGDTPGPTPFDNGTNALGGLPPVAFAPLGSQALLLSGAYTATNESIFTLPVTWRPISPQPIIFAWSDYSAIEVAQINTDGTVVDHGTIT